MILALRKHWLIVAISSLTYEITSKKLVRCNDEVHAIVLDLYIRKSVFLLLGSSLSLCFSWQHYWQSVLRYTFSKPLITTQV